VGHSAARAELPFVDLRVDAPREHLAFQRANDDNGLDEAHILLKKSREPVHAGRHVTTLTQGAMEAVRHELLMDGR
jgi:hypothetical protein